MLLHLLDQRHQRHGLRIEALVDRAKPLGVGKVGAHKIFDVGILDFDRHRLAGLQRRAMHLRERGRRHRRVLDIGEDFAHLASKLRLQDARNLRPRPRRHRVMALAENRTYSGGKTSERVPITCASLIIRPRSAMAFR